MHTHVYIRACKFMHKSLPRGLCSLGFPKSSRRARNSRAICALLRASSRGAPEGLGEIREGPRPYRGSSQVKPTAPSLGGTPVGERIHPGCSAAHPARSGEPCPALWSVGPQGHPVTLPPGCLGSGGPLCLCSASVPRILSN